MDLDLDAEQLIGSVIQSTLLGRGKRAHGVGRLVSRRGGLLNGKTLLALAGVAWGLYEAATSQQGQAATGSQLPGSSPASAASPAAGTQQPVVPPPLPSAVGRAPAESSAAPPATAPPATLPDGVRRVIRLTVSAARADGNLSDVERESILAQARQAGVEAVVASEIDHPVPLAEIVASVTDPAQRADLYTLAFAITRADEQVTGGERVYLAQLAHLLGLSPEDTSRLEAETAARIDAERAAGPEHV